MRLPLIITASLFLSFNAHADTSDCNNISCDCSALPSQTWQDVCAIKENNLKKACLRNPSKKVGYCSIHGPQATLLPLSLNLATTSLEQSNSIKTLNHKSAAIYWSMHKDLDFIEGKVAQQKYDEAQQRLSTIEANLETLFDIQKQTAKRLTDSRNPAESELSWRNFSEDTAAVSEKLRALGEKLIADQASRVAHTAAVNVLQTAGNMYEHVGYGYSQGMRHQLAANAWKSAAETSASIMKHSPNATQDSMQQYRYQAATRLHRASYNWMLGTDEKAAQQALAESQAYIDEKDEGLDKIIEDKSQELISSY